MWRWFRRAPVRDVQCPNDRDAPCSQRLEEANDLVQALHTSHQEVVDWFRDNSKVTTDLLRQVEGLTETVREMRKSLQHL